MAQLYYTYGAMNSGKSIDILKVPHNYEEQGKKVALFTTAIDTRSGKGKVSSRIKPMERDANVIHEDSNIYEMVKEIHTKDPIVCILVDECQFLSAEQAHQVAQVVDELDVPAMVYGLKNDFENKLFEGSEAFLILADKIAEVKTICWYCNKKATMNLRTNNELTGQIAVGGNEDYRSVCRKHYIALHQ